MELRDLGDRLAGDVVLPGDEAWDAARQAWNLAVDQRPVAVVYPASADDVVETVRFAAEHGSGSPSTPAATTRADRLVPGHAPAQDGADARDRRSTPAARRPASRRACSRSRSRSPPASTASRTSPARRPTSGSWATRSAAGSAGWSARTASPATASSAAEVVIADGRLVRADRDTEPELFWALRGGGGNVGAVTALELELFPVAEIYAGALFWPIERAAEILAAWRAWIETVPEACESLGRHAPAAGRPVPARAPARPVVRPRRGGDHRHGRGGRGARPAAPGPRPGVRHRRDAADEPPQPREHGPRLPAPLLGRGPPARRTCTPEAIDALVEAFVGSPLLHVEVRHLGGAAASRSPDHGVLDAIDQPFVASRSA